MTLPNAKRQKKHCALRKGNTARCLRRSTKGLPSSSSRATRAARSSAAATACRCDPPITPSETGFRIEETELDFGRVLEGTRPQKTVRVVSTGTAGLSLTLGATAPFEVQDELELPGGASVSVPVIFEAGNIRFGLEMRRLPMGDGGLAIHVLADIGGTPGKKYTEETELLAFDHFWNGAHYHYGPRNKNHRIYWDRTLVEDPLAWTLEQFEKGKLPAMIERKPLNCGTASTTRRDRFRRARSLSILPLRSPENDTSACGREQYSSSVSAPGRSSPRSTLTFISRNLRRLALAGSSVV